MAWAALRLLDRVLGVQVPMPAGFRPGARQHAAIVGVPLVSLWGSPGLAERIAWQQLCVDSRAYKVRGVLRHAVRSWKWTRLGQVGWSSLRLALGLRDGQAAARSAAVKLMAHQQSVDECSPSSAGRGSD